MSRRAGWRGSIRISTRQSPATAAAPFKGGGRGNAPGGARRGASDERAITRQRHLAAKATEKHAKGTPAAKQKETREEHRARRQAQWEAACDKRRDAWYQQIIKNGGSKELAGELVDAYTPEVARFGKPPRVVFGTATSRTGLSNDGTELVIRAGADAAEIKRRSGISAIASNGEHSTGLHGKTGIPARQK